MTRWAYLLVDITGGNHARQLAPYGEQGWEAFHVELYQDDWGSGYRYWLKRPSGPRENFAWLR